MKFANNQIDKALLKAKILALLLVERSQWLLDCLAELLIVECRQHNILLLDELNQPWAAAVVWVLKEVLAGRDDDRERRRLFIPIDTQQVVQKTPPLWAALLADK